MKQRPDKKRRNFFPVAATAAAAAAPAPAAAGSEALEEKEAGDAAEFEK